MIPDFDLGSLRTVIFRFSGPCCTAPRKITSWTSGGRPERHLSQAEIQTLENSEHEHVIPKHPVSNGQDSLSFCPSIPCHEFPPKKLAMTVHHQDHPIQEVHVQTPPLRRAKGSCGHALLLSSRLHTNPPIPFYGCSSLPACLHGAKGKTRK